MIKSLDIRNFKSIKHLTLNCRRINIFIGAPNTGKSNILETIGLLSHIAHGDTREFIRFENMRNLFYDENLEEKISVSFDQNTVQIKFKDGSFLGDYLKIDTATSHAPIRVFEYLYSGEGPRTTFRNFFQFKFYRFKTIENFPSHHSEYLNPPYGNNLLIILLSYKGLRNIVSEFFSEFGFRVVLEPQTGTIKIQKELDGILIHFPYSLASETLQRIIFYLTAIHSNKNSIIAFEEPESHAFPYYTKYLAERIALDKNQNQYLISTHNPYFLMSILEKTPKKEVAVFVTYLQNYQTKAKMLSQKDIEEILDKGIDAFFNIERFIK